jgi:hypothetical protein
VSRASFRVFPEMPRQINTRLGDVGGSMCNDSRSHLVFIYGSLNAGRDVVLVLQPVLLQNFLGWQGALFPQDNVRLHMDDKIFLRLTPLTFQVAKFIRNTKCASLLATIIQCKTVLETTTNSYLLYKCLIKVVYLTSSCLNWGILARVPKKPN